MAYIMRKMVACVTVFSFLLSNTVYADSIDNNTLRILASANTGMAQGIKISMVQRLVDASITALKQENDGKIVFGTSGFRGINSLNKLTVAIIAQANADYIKEAGLADKFFAICKDTRAEGDVFAMITAAVFAANNIKVVVSDGYTPTPVIAYATVANKYGGAVNFTASHNPKEYKGYKFSPAHGGAAPQEVTDAIQEKANNYLKHLESGAGMGKALSSNFLRAMFDYKEMFNDFHDLGDIQFIEPMEAYVGYLFNLKLQGVDIFDKVRQSQFMIAASGLHGTAGPYLERIFGPKGLNKLACDVLNKEPREDFGDFKAPEANEKNLKDLMRVVASYEKTLGVSGDGDGDREGVVDLNGRFIEPNELSAIFYWYLHEIKGLKGGIAKTVATTNLLNALAGRFDEECYEKQVGFKNFKEEMLNGRAIVAAESSAHIGINTFSWDDAFLCALLAYQIVSDKDNIEAKSGAALNNLTDILNYIQGKITGTYFSFYEGKISADDTTKKLLLSWNQNPEMLSLKLNEPKFLSILKTSNFEAAEISTLPKKGVKVVFTDKSWFCLRPSGTEPLVRLYTEGAGGTDLDASKKRESLRKLAETLLSAEDRDKTAKVSSSGMRIGDELAVRKVLEEGYSPDGILKILTEASVLGPEDITKNDNPFAKIGFDPGLKRIMLGWVPDSLKRLIDILIPVERIGYERLSFFGSIKDVKSFIFTGIGGSGLGVSTIVDVFGQPEGSKIYTLTTPSRDQQGVTIEDLKARYGGNLKQALEESVLFAISKSGSTAETREQVEYFEYLYKANGIDPKKHILLITDPDTRDKSIDKNAFAERIDNGYGFLFIQLDSANDIGGRFTSPMTMIPLLPLDIINTFMVNSYLDNAYKMVKIKETENIIEKQQFITLGVFLDIMSRMKVPHAFNKLTLLLPDELKALAPWLVQLVHESLGKDGKGIEILYGEELTPDMAEDFKQQKRVFLRVNLTGKAGTEPGLWQAIRAEDLPTFEITVNGKEDLGGLQAGFQLTVATVALLSDIHFVIQPAVEGHKNATRNIMKNIEPGEAVKLPDITPENKIGSKEGRLSVYFYPLIDAGIFTFEQIEEEVKRLNSDMDDIAAVFTAILNLIEKLERFEQVQFGMFGTMSDDTKKAFANIRREVFTKKGVPSLIATWPDDLHANEQDMADGLGRKITFTIAVYPTEAATIPGGEAVNVKMQNQLAAPFVGLMNSRAKVQGMICGIRFKGTQEDMAKALDEFFKSVNDLQQDYSTAKASSGGILDMPVRSERITDLTRIVKKSLAIKKRFDKAIAMLDASGGQSASLVQKELVEIQKMIYAGVDKDIASILSNLDPAISEQDKKVLKDMEGLFYQAQQHVQNIGMIRYADDGKLSEDITPRVLILPATEAMLGQASPAADEMALIKENIKVMIVISKKPLDTIFDIQTGALLFEQGKDKVKIDAKHVSVILTENQRDMTQAVRNALGTNNTLIMSDIDNSQYIPFSQLAMLAKAHLILNEIGVTSRKAGPYRSAFLAIWKGITGSALPVSIEDFMANPAAYVIRILTAPVSVLDKTEIKALHEKAARIWA
jgi:phosphoglucomutase